MTAKANVIEKRRTMVKKNVIARRRNDDEAICYQ
jgi:hypothetical protein